MEEISLALSYSRTAAGAKVAFALDLAQRLPDTLAAWEQGRICAARARIISEGTSRLSAQDAAFVEAQLLEPAQTLSPARLKTKVSALAEALDPRDVEDRHTDAAEGRRVIKTRKMTGWPLSGRCSPPTTPPPSGPRSPPTPNSTAAPSTPATRRPGTLLEAGTARHDPPPALREYVLASDGGCSWANCAQTRVDLDHIVAYPAGPTAAGQLDAKCRHHHRTKQRWDFHTLRHEDGTTTITTPIGHAYTSPARDHRPPPVRKPAPGKRIHEPAANDDDAPPY